MKQRVFEHVVVDNTKDVLSQAYSLSGHNQVRLEITLISSSGAASAGLKYYPTYSIDGHNWDDDASSTNSTGNNDAPYRDLETFSGPTDKNVGGYRYVRAKVIQSDATRTLFSAEMTLFSVDS